MSDTPSISTKLLLSVLFFPYFFQSEMIRFAWGAEDVTWVMMLKRLLILYPTGAVIVGLWMTMFCLLTVIIRQNRRDYVITLAMTWWDLGRAIFSFWGGMIKFIFELLMGLFGVFNLFLMTLWVTTKDVLLAPVRMIRRVSKDVLSPGIPWIAVILTLIWAVIEAVIFTYVMTPLVIDTLSNMTGDQLSEGMIRIPLFIFMLFLILGSYSVLSSWTEAIKTKNVNMILKIGVIEFVTVMVEVLFLYREFVDSLVPWFAQHSEGFELGIFGTLLIASLVWVGIRGMSWFLFAAHGTPTILAVIQGAGVGINYEKERKENAQVSLSYVSNFFANLKRNSDWISKKGEDILGAFLVPPLHVLAAVVNFITMLVSAEQLFKLPFDSLQQVIDTKKTLAQRSNGK